MKFQLFLDTTDPELFRKATCELGTIFYRELRECSGDYEIVYFSGSRVARFIGAPNDSIIRLCEASGFEVETLELDADLGVLRVKQKAVPK